MILFPVYRVYKNTQLCMLCEATKEVWLGKATTVSVSWAIWHYLSYSIPSWHFIMQTPELGVL